MAQSLSVAFAVLSLARLSAEVVVSDERFDRGVVEIEFQLTPEKLERGAHGGWDFFDGETKQLWIGTGWGGDAGRWGIWTPAGNRRDFREPVAVGKSVHLRARIEFGTAVAGDELVTLSLVEGETEREVARLEKARITAINQARSFVRSGGGYEFGGLELSAAKESISAVALFQDRVQPMFAEKCLACHGDDEAKIKGGLDMRTRAGLLAGGESGLPTLVPGKPEESLLYLAATWQDPEFEMPPKVNDRLSEAQLADLRNWIEAGAPWVEKKILPTPDFEGKFGQWSEPDSVGKVRVITSRAQSESWANRGYEPGTLWAYQVPVSQKPPSNQHPIDGFIEARLKEAKIEPAPRARPTELVRRLTYSLTGLPPTAKQLQAESGTLMEELLESPHYGERMAQHWLDVTRYADSNGFSRDEVRPDAHQYRSYVIESFNRDKPYDQFVREQIAGDELGIAGQEALAFLWMGPWEITNMTSAAVARQMWLDDVVNSIGVTFLGHELRCAKCHDHKFDPIPTRDYYAMQAVFGATKHHVRGGQFKIQPQSPQTVSILKGGALESPTEIVSPGFLSAVAISNQSPVPSGSRGRRAALANWIASPENPFTARVIVNRVWQMHFGRGLVATPNNFGVNGMTPSHPELLDWLAVWFVEEGWSLKELHRLILTSETYQRSTQHPQPSRLKERDPENQRLAVFSPRRLTAEEIRDSMLIATGELNRRVGGPGFRAEINWEVAFQPRLAMGKLVPPWEPEPTRAERNRRSLYANRIRNLGHPLMEVFNRPNSGLSCEKRDETTVVTQAFTLFHSEFSNQRSLALADRVVRLSGTQDVSTLVEATFQTVLGRAPDLSEAQDAEQLVQERLVHHRSHPPEPVALPTEVQMTNVVEKTGEEKITTFRLNALRNYERDLQPWQVGPETRALAELALVLFNTSEFLHVY
ncbi:MAG: PSD1 and planctomycete cytochrome C domain-containing protein [Verrucomicrobiota bacterium]